MIETVVARKREVVDAFGTAPAGLLNKIRQLLVERDGVDHNPITTCFDMNAKLSLGQLTNWANKYHKLEELEEGIAVALTATANAKTGRPGKNAKYVTLENYGL